MAQKHTEFEWDDRKAESNLTKHGVSFGLAEKVLEDADAERFHLEKFDEAHSDEEEERWITTGSFPERRSVIVIVVWTPRGFAGEITRIISARKPTKSERRNYEQRHSH